MKRFLNETFGVAFLGGLLFAAGCCCCTRTPSNAGAPDPTTPAAVTAPAEAAQRPGEATAPSAELLVDLKPGTEPAAFARKHGLLWKRTLEGDPNMHVFAASSLENARKARAALVADPLVRRAYSNSPSPNEPSAR